jgi:hypothetical protein
MIALTLRLARRRRRVGRPAPLESAALAALIAAGRALIPLLWAAYGLYRSAPDRPARQPRPRPLTPDR